MVSQIQKEAKKAKEHAIRDVVADAAKLDSNIDKDTHRDDIDTKSGKSLKIFYYSQSILFRISQVLFSFDIFLLSYIVRPLSYIVCPSFVIFSSCSYSFYFLLFSPLLYFKCNTDFCKLAKYCEHG